jgi:hypothetical protein
MIDIKQIWESQKSNGELIIRTRIDGISHLKCFAATNHITGQHLYIMSISQLIELPDFTKFKFKGVHFFSERVADKSEVFILLTDNNLKDIFALFIQNIIEDIEETVSEKEALDVTLNVVFKWKKLFDKINFNGLTLERQKGLLGELFFMDKLLDIKSNTSVLNAWTGPDNEDKDYRFGSLGIEVKLTSSKYPKIKITNEGQLDTQNLIALFLVLYTVEEVKENGCSLNDIIDQIRTKLEYQNDLLKFFNERLMAAGYFEEDRNSYSKQFSIKQEYIYSILDDFPRIIKNNLPIGVYNTSYNIELSAVTDFLIEKEIFLKNF